MAANDAQPPANGTQDAPEFTGKLIDLQQQDLLAGFVGGYGFKGSRAGTDHQGDSRN